MQQFESDTICWAHTLPLLAECPGSGKAWAENRTKNQSRKETNSRERDSHGRALAAGCCITHKVHDFIFICCYSSYTRDPSSLLDSGELVLFSLLRFSFDSGLWLRISCLRQFKMIFMGFLSDERATPMPT